MWSVWCASDRAELHQVQPKHHNFISASHRMLQLFFHPCDPLYFLLSSLLLLSRASSSLWFLFFLFLSFYLMFRFLILKQEHDVHRREFAIQFASQLHFIDNDDDGCDFFSSHFCMHKRIPLECRVLGSSDLERYGSLRSRSMVGVKSCVVCGKTSEKSPPRKVATPSRALLVPKKKSSAPPTQQQGKLSSNSTIHTNTSESLVSSLLCSLSASTRRGRRGEEKRKKNVWK